MQVAEGDLVDADLLDSLVHELLRCRRALLRFQELKDEPPGHYPFERHDAYVEFLTHLFEFLVGCFKRDQRSTRRLSADEVDKRVALELSKALRHLTEVASFGMLCGETNPSFRIPETSKIQSDFAQDLRRVRNLSIHVDPRRARRDDCGIPSVSEFYRRYHAHAVLLFSWLWSSWQHSVSLSLTLGEITSCTFIDPLK